MSSDKKIYRAGKGHVLGGVCAGIADYLAIDVIIVRAIWLVLTLVHGIGAVAYLVCLVLIPKNPLHEQLPISEQKKDDNYGLYIGLALIIIGLSVVFHRWFNFFFWDLDWLFFTFHWKVVWPVLFILLGVWFILRASKTEDDDKPRDTFYRSPDKRMISGVCGGLSELWNIDVTIVRVGYALATLFTAVWLGIITYVVLAVVIKERDLIPEAEVVEPEEKQPPKRKRTPRKKAAQDESQTKAEPEQSEENQNKGETDEQK